MTIDYRVALQGALEELCDAEGACGMRTPKGARLVVDRIEGTNFEKIVCVGKRATAAAKGTAGEVAIKLWHMRKDWRDEGDDEDAIAERMIRRAAAEHLRIRQLSGCRHWLQLVADLASETEAQIGPETYAAIFLEYFPGKDLTELLRIVRPPGGRRKGVAGDDDGDDDSDSDAEDEDEDEVAAFEAHKAAMTPERLDEELTIIKTTALGVLQGMKEANEAGFYFESDGSEGPFLGDVLYLDGKVKLVDTEPLSEYDEGDDRRFTAEALVYSPLGEYIRAWWESTAVKLGMQTGQQCPDERCTHPPRCLVQPCDAVVAPLHPRKPFRFPPTPTPVVFSALLATAGTGRCWTSMAPSIGCSSSGNLHNCTEMKSSACFAWGPRRSRRPWTHRSRRGGPSSCKRRS